ncbi:MAG: hypothetical protein K2X27_20460, partial [Candidatus Obscuribacterales bacterium]|nr:hypothetical protein [Candidatus Obscuribacterales bacterium]
NEVTPALKDFGNLILDGAKNTADHTSIAEERQRLDLGLESRIKKPEDREFFRKEMDEFEKRAVKDGLTPEEVSQTYKEIGRLMEENKEAIVPQDRRLLLAKQVLHQAAYPHDIDQGYHKTCNVSSLSERLYARNPAQADRVVADLALSSDASFQTASGKKVSIDKDSMKPDQEAEIDPVPDGKRSYANQLLQLAMVNAYWTGRNEHDGVKCRGPIKYTQEHSVSKNNSGERLKDASGKLLGTEPGISHAGMVETYRMFSNQKDKDKPFLIVDKSMSADKVKAEDGSNGLIFVNTPEQLKTEILKHQAEKNMPLIVSIDPKMEPWLSAGASSSTHGDGVNTSKPRGAEISDSDRPIRDSMNEIDPDEKLRGNVEPKPSADGPQPKPELPNDPPHVINIVASYQNKEGKWMVAISNTWGKKSDFTMPLDQLHATLARRRDGKESNDLDINNIFDLTRDNTEK